MNHNSVELLAPAGGMAQLKAAVENGADAVYIGGTRFNARMKAGNFTDDEIREALVYAHSRDVKIYVTINILLDDEELYDAVGYAASLYSMGVDALIVQDLGFASLIRKFIPDMEMHFSTQGSIYNRSGVLNALNAGFSRVVLAREMTLEEIRKVTDLCEIEVFVHGALCMCYSGQCQMSRMLGGRSGNRGVCAQPCRLPYTDDRGEKSYILSPKDLWSLDGLQELIEAGVASLKIEGRMKSAEYVATVVRIYRKYIDMYYSQGRIEISDDDRYELLQIFNRGGFTEGYLRGNPDQDILSGDLPKHQGVHIGKVVRDRDRNLVEIKLDEGCELDMGDGIEIRGRETGGNVISYLKSKKDSLIIGDVRGRFRAGDDVYRISSRSQLAEAAELSEEYRRKRDIGAVFRGIIGEFPELCIYTGDVEVSVKGEHPVEEAINRPTEYDRVRQQIAKLGNTPYNLKYFTAELDEGCAVSIGEINSMRRRAADILTQKLAGERTAPDLSGLREHINELKTMYRDAAECSQKELGKGCDRIWLENALKGKLPEIKGGMLVFSNVTKGGEDRFIEKLLEEEGKNGSGSLKDRRVIINNLGWMEEFIKEGARVYAGSGMNLTNTAAIEYIKRTGAEVYAMSAELDRDTDLLMITEHPVRSDYIRDRKGAEYSIAVSPFGDKYYLIKNRGDRS